MRTPRLYTRRFRFSAKLNFSYQVDSAPPPTRAVATSTRYGFPSRVAVMPRFNGKVIVIDVGLTKIFDGPPAFLTIEDGKYFAVHRGRRIELPAEGGSVLEYLGSAAALEPANSRLRRAIQNRRP